MSYKVFTVPVSGMSTSYTAWAYITIKAEDAKHAGYLAEDLFGNRGVVDHESIAECLGS